jgi:hypothetical protein
MIQNSNPLSGKIGGNMPQNNGGFNIQNAMKTIQSKMNEYNCKTPQELAMKLAKENGIEQNQLNQMMSQIQSMFGRKK